MKAKTVIALIILCSLVLTGCNMNAQPSATPDQVGTEVSRLLTKIPSTTLTSIATSVVTTTVSATTTATVENTATPTVTPTPTQAPDDPSVSLGSPAWQDTFDSGKSWGLGSSGYSDDYTKITVEDGSMVLTSYSNQGWLSWRLNSQQPQNFYLEGTFSTQSCSGGDQYGMIFRAPDYTSGYGYYLAATCDGRIGLRRWDSSGTSAVLDWKTIAGFNSGSNQTNRIGILVNGSSMTIYLNGIKTEELNDSGISAAGHLGVFIAGQEASGFTVKLSEIAYWNLQ